MKEAHERVTKAVGTTTGRSLVNVMAEDIVELAKSVANPSEVVKALLSGAGKCKPGIDVWQQAMDVRELLEATGPAPAQPTS